MKKNNDYFTIEKSRDGLNFEPLATVKGSGNSSALTNYQETDLEPYEGLSYYRLRQTDYDLKSSYSDLVSVDIKPSNQNMSLFPNPTNGPFKINFNFSKKDMIFVCIKDLEGKECFSKTLVSERDDGIYLPDNNLVLPPGFYIVIAITNTCLFSEKLIVR